MTTFSDQYAEYLKRINKETKFGQAVPYQYTPDNQVVGFWKDAQEKIAQGWRLVFPNQWKNKKQQAPEWTQVRLPTSTDMWKAGRPGAWTPGATGTYDEMMREQLLARHPGAVDILPSGVPTYGGKNEVEERMLRARAALKYGSRYIDDFDLNETWSPEQVQEYQTSNEAQRIAMVTKAIQGKANDMAAQQDEKTSHGVYEWIFENVGQYYHAFRQKGADLMEAGFGVGYLHFSGDEEYRKEWEKQDAAMEGDFLARNVYNPLTQLQGANMFADFSEFAAWQWLPWNWGKEDKVHSLANTSNTIAWLREHPGISEAVAKNTLVNDYWSTFGEEWLNPVEWITDKAIDIVFPLTLGKLASKGLMKLFPKIARKASKVTPGLAKFFRATDGKLDNFIGGIDDVAFDSIHEQGFIRTFMDDVVETANNLDDWANRWGIFENTADAKSHLIHQEAKYGLRWVVTSLGHSTDPARVMHRLETISKLASKDADEVAMAWREVSKIPNADFWFTASGQEAAIVFNKLFDTLDPKIMDDLFEEIAGISSKSKKVAKYMEVMDNLALKYTNDMFPTLETIIKRGGKAADDMPSYLKAAAAFHKKSRKVYDPITQWFSNWYLGKTPGYAIRNGLQNFSQTIYDLGIGSVAGASHLDDAFNWAGADELIEAGEDLVKIYGDLFVGMERGLGGVAGGLGKKIKRTEGNWKNYLDARWWSERFEVFGGKTIFGHSYPKEMKKMLRRNLSRQFVANGVDQKTANLFEDAILRNQGNTKKAKEYVENVVRQGFWRDASFRNLTTDLQQKAQHYRLEEMIYKWLDESPSIEDFDRAVDDFIEDFLDAAEEAVRKEGAPAPPRGMSTTPGVVANAVTYDGAPQDIANAYNSTRAANKRTNQLTWSAWETMREEMVDKLIKTGKFTDQEARLQILQWADEVKLHTDSMFTPATGELTGADILGGKFSPDETGNPRLWKMEQDIKQRYADRESEIERLLDDPATLNKNMAEYWAKHFEPKFGSYAGQNIYDVRQANQRLMLLEDREFWNTWTNENHRMIRRMSEGVVEKAVRETGSLGEQIPVVEHVFRKATASMEEGKKYQTWVPQGYIRNQLTRARRMKTETKRLWTFATEYASMYGISTTFIKDGKEFLNHRKLVAIINKQLGTDFKHLNAMTGIKESQIKAAMKAQSLDRYLRIVDEPQQAIDLVLKVIQPGEYSNKTILERLTSEQLKDLRRFNTLLGTANPDLAKKFDQAIMARFSLPDPASAHNHDAYNELVKRREEIDKVISQAGDEVLELLGVRKQDLTARTLEPFAQMANQGPDAFMDALRRMDPDSSDFLYRWLQADNPDLAEKFKKIQQNFASMGTAGEEQLQDLWKFMDDKVPDDVAAKLDPFGKTFKQQHEAIIKGKRPYGFYGGEFGESPKDVPFGVKVQRGAVTYKGEPIDITYKKGRHSSTLTRDFEEIQAHLDRIEQIDDPLLEGMELGKLFGYPEENIDAWAQGFVQIETEYKSKLAKLTAQEQLIYSYGAEIAAYIQRRSNAGTTWIANALEDPIPDINDFIHLWDGEDARTYSGQIYDSRDEIRKFADDLKVQIRANWDNTNRIDATNAKRMLDDWDKIDSVGQGMVQQARMGAMRTVQEQRDFILHNYENRRNFDTLLAYLYPYHFWHTRNAAKWAKRVAQRPGIARNYARFLERLERINEDQPEWFRHNIRVTGMLGYTEDNPLLLNLDALLNPTYQALKAFNPFIDRNKRDTAFARLLDDSGRMMSIHSLMGILYGFGRYVQGDKEQGAAWMSRLIPQTKVTSAVSSVIADKLGIDKWRRGVELDPAIGLQAVFESGGDWSSYLTAFDPYEQKRVAMGYQILVSQGKYTEEEIIDAVMSGDPNHPATVEAHGIAQSKKNFGDLFSFIGGPGMQVRSDDERKIMAIDEEFKELFAGMEFLDENETSQMYDYMREKYPQYYNTMMLTRKDRDTREKSFVYNVMSRIPPGQGVPVYEAVGIDYADVQEFYNTKGASLEKMTEPDRLKFMAGIYEISAVAAFPDSATRNEWNEVKRRYGQMREELEGRYGKETFAARDYFFQLLKEDQEQAYQFLDANPKVNYLMSDETQWKWTDPLMTKYYASFDNGRNMLNSEMYDRLDAQFPNGRELNDAYWAARSAGQSIKPSEELKEYWDQKRALEEIYGAKIVEWGRHLPDGPMDFPKRFDPNEPPEGISRGAQELSQLELYKAQTPIQYQWSWQDWERMMDPTTARLVQDWAFRGAELPQAVRGDLEYLLEGMGGQIDLDEAMYLLQQAADQAGAEFYGPDNPPWWVQPGQ